MSKHHTEAEVIDSHVGGGFITLIVDVWSGDREDITTGIDRFVGVWPENIVSDDALPDFSQITAGRYGYKPKPQPKIWEYLCEIKAADEDARLYAKAQEHELANDGRYRYGTSAIQAQLYRSFLSALDVIAANEEDPEAWKAVDAFFDSRSLVNEK